MLPATCLRAPKPLHVSLLFSASNCGQWVQKLLGNLVLTKASGSRSIVGASIKEPFHVIKEISTAIYGAIISCWEELLLGFIVLVSSVRGGREHLRGKASSENVGQNGQCFPFWGQCEVFGLSTRMQYPRGWWMDTLP